MAAKKTTKKGDSGGAKAASKVTPIDGEEPKRKRARPAKKTVTETRRTAEKAQRVVAGDDDSDRLKVPDHIPGLSERERAEVPGARLLELLFDEANRKSMGMQQLAEQIGFSRPNLYALRQKRRSVPGMARHYKEACAEFLGLPYIAVLMAAEVIRPSDFYVPIDDPEREVNTALEFIKRDPLHGKRVPADIQDADFELKLYVVECFEQATGKRLLTNRVSLSREMEQQRLYDKDRESYRQALIKKGTHTYTPTGEFVTVEEARDMAKFPPS